LPQSGKNWYLKLKEELLKNGFKTITSDSCVFVNYDQMCFFVLSAYVDNFTTLNDNNQKCDRIINSLRKEFEIKETTKSKKFLGIKIENTEHGIYLSQVEYIEKLFSKYGMSECKSVMTPITGEDRTSNEGNEKCNVDSYQELIGELLYLANSTRPDVTFVTSYPS